MTRDEALEKLRQIIIEAGGDVSFGYTQVTVPTAGGYGIGDGSNTEANIAAVREALFDRDTSINLGARILGGCWQAANGWEPRDLQALLCYNSGSCQAEGNWYWERYSGNIANFRAALEWAHTQLNS